MSGSTSWATPEDWERYRGVITELYEKRNLKLPEVMKIMGEKYNFRATPRMYKTRFTKWGLQKTLRFNQVTELLRQSTYRAIEGKESVRLIRGKPVDDHRIRKYLRSLPADKHNRLAQLAHGQIEDDEMPIVSIVSCRTPSPEPPVSHLFHLPSPEDVKLPEECLLAIRDYVDGALSMGLWTLNPTEILRAGPLFGFWNQGLTAKRLLTTGQTKQAFRLLNKCFHEYKGLLAAQSPLLFPYTYTVSLVFADGYPALYMSFLKYITELSGILHGESHPLHVLFSRAYHMGPNAARQFAHTITQTYVEACSVQPGSIATIDLEGFLGIRFADINIHRYEDAETTLRGMLAKLAPYEGDESLDVVLLDTKDDLSVVVMKQGRYAESRRIMLESLRSPALPRFPLLLASCYRNLFILAREQGDQKEAIMSGHRLVAFASNTWGLSDNKTITVLTDFMTYLRKIGDDNAADRIEQDFDAAMDELSKNISEFNLEI